MSAKNPKCLHLHEMPLLHSLQIRVNFRFAERSNERQNPVYFSHDKNNSTMVVCAIFYNFYTVKQLMCGDLFLQIIYRNTTL